jgi:hypothetical protein
MEVTLSAELLAKLARVAQERGTDPQNLAREAIVIKVMLTRRPSRYTFPSVPRSNTNVVGTSVSGSSLASTQYAK